LTGYGTSAAHASRHSGLEGVVLVDVGGTLHETHADKHAGNETALLGSGDVTFGSWDLLGDGHLGTGRESTSPSRIADGGVWASSVSGDDVDSSGDRTSIRNLRKGGAGLSHDSGHSGEGVGASLGLSETVSGGLLAIEDGGVDFGLLVGSSTWDDTSLDTETSGVSTSITSLSSVSKFERWRRMKAAHHDCDLAMGGNERRGCKNDEENLGQHVCSGGDWFKNRRVENIAVLKNVSGCESIARGFKSEIRKRRLFESMKW
jgi:hypothetical protein